MRKKFLAIAFCVSVSITSAASAQVVNRGTSAKTSSTERVPLMTLIIPALEQLKGNRTAQGCLTLLSNPAVKLRQGVLVQVARNGLAVDGYVNEALTATASRIIACAEVLSWRAPEMAELLRQVKPNRADAVKRVTKILGAQLEDDYEKFRSSSAHLFDVAVRIAPGNSGRARENVIMNDRVLYFEKKSPEDPRTYRELVPGGDNQIAAKNSPIRELIFEGIYDYKTDPVDVATVCSGPGKSFRPCEATFQMSYDGRAATVTKNGQKWLDDTMIGGAEYTITLEAESTTGTTRKVER